MTGTNPSGLYVADLLLAALSTALLLAPVAYHRLVFRQHLKERLVRMANGLAIAGLVTVALAVLAAVLLVVSFVDGGAPAVIVGVFLGCVFATLWFVLPLVRREEAADSRARRGHNMHQ